VSQSEEDVRASLARIERELDGLKGALLLLGVKQCCWCRKYFLSPDARALFDGDELVCYGCIQEWWQHRCPELSIEKRQAVEHKLLRWLVSHHDAKVIRQTEKLPQRIELKILAACERCGGTGKSDTGGKCHPCGGCGNFWVVRLVPEAL